MITKRVYIDLVDNNYDKKTSLAIGPWCFDNVLDPIQIYEKQLNKEIPIININGRKLIKNRKIFFKKYKNLFCDYLKKKNNLKNINNKLLIFYIKVWVFQLHDLLFFCERYVLFLKKKFKKKKILIIKYYRSPEIKKINSLLEFHSQCSDINFINSFIFFLLKKENKKNWKFKSYNYKIIKKKNYSFLGIYKFFKLKIEKFFFSNVIEVYDMYFHQKFILSRLLRKNINV